MAHRRADIGGSQEHWGTEEGADIATLFCYVSLVECGNGSNLWGVWYSVSGASVRWAAMTSTQALAHISAGFIQVHKERVHCRGENDEQARGGEASDRLGALDIPCLLCLPCIYRRIVAS